MRTAMWKRWLAGAACVLAMAGCTSDPSDPPATGSRTEPPRNETPVDRDEAAVWAALRQLDFCAVLTTAKGGGTPVARSPFSCEIAGVSVGVADLATEGRLKLPTREIGGARAYVDAETCRVHLPVSFTLTLVFEGDRGAGCVAPLEEIVAAAVGVLADPPVLAAGPRWDACTALGQALGEDADLSSSLPVGAICLRLRPAASLTFDYGLPLIGETSSGTVGGVEVVIQEPDAEGEPCSIAWRSGTGAPEEWVAVAAPDCAAATTLAESALTVLAAAPPETTPQRPLLYAADEPDTPYRGPCAHLEPRFAKYCRPFVEVTVPDGTAAILSAAERDADVQCAVARDAITTRFGAQLVPVAEDENGHRSCYFVEPDRGVQIRFQLENDPVAGVEEVFKVRDAEIAGRPGYVEDVPDQRQYQVWVALTDDPRADGSVEITVEGGPASRGGAGAPADAPAKVEQVITEILATYFS